MLSQPGLSQRTPLLRRSVSIEHFGASADYKTLFQRFGITADAVVAAACENLGLRRSIVSQRPGAAW